MNDFLQTVDWSRAQFALTAIYHWLFVPLTLGLSVMIAIMETRYYRTGDEEWKRMTKFWMRIFGINFAIGVATGIILEFEFGTNWSNYSPLRGRHIRCAAGHRGHHGLLHGEHLHRRDVLRLGQGKPTVPPRGHVAHGHRRQPFGAVDSGGQRMDAVSDRVHVQPRHGAQRDDIVRRRAAIARCRRQVYPYGHLVVRTGGRGGRGHKRMVSAARPREAAGQAQHSAGLGIRIDILARGGTHGR